MNAASEVFGARTSRPARTLTAMVLAVLLPAFLPEARAAEPPPGQAPAAKEIPPPDAPSRDSAAPPAKPWSVDELLQRIAENQEQAVEARTRIVYQQSVRGRLTRGGGKLAREERRAYTVTPTAKGSEKELVKVEGQYEKGGKLYPYSDPAFRHKKVDLDGAILESIIDDKVNNKGTRDGLDNEMFPFTKAEQVHYDFRLKSRETYAGRKVVRLEFEPKPKPKDAEEWDGRHWSGEALVDEEAAQPVLITTHLARGIPGWVRFVFGINIKQLGYNVTYREVEPGLWFPHSYGTEFWLRLFFGYGRTITMSVENTDFRVATTETKMTFTGDEVP